MMLDSSEAGILRDRFPWLRLVETELLGQPEEGGG
jgi:hypothetical protein